MKIINNQNTLKEKPRNNYWPLVVKKSLGYWLFLLLVFAFSCSESTSSGGGGGDNDYSARVEGVVADRKEDYGNGFIYGTVKAEQDGVALTNATFELINMNPPNDEIIINPTNGVIMVASSLEVGNYTFTVEVTIPNTEGGSPEIRTIDETLTIDPRTINQEDFTVPPGVNERTGYPTRSLGTIVANAGVTATFAILNSTAPNDAITINPTTGEITVATGLNSGTYFFSVEVAGTKNYTESFTIDNLKFSVADKPIQKDDFTISLTSSSAESGYANFSYGRVVLRDDVTATATFAIVKSDTPNGAITIDATTGVITIASGLAEGTYTFSVEVTGTGEYGGSFTIDNLKFSVTDNPIEKDDFNVSLISTSAEFGYSSFTYGKVELVAPATATFAIVGINAPAGVSVPPDALTLDENGDLTVAPGLAVGEYTFQVQATGTGDYGGTADSVELTLNIMLKTITVDDFTRPANARRLIGYTDTGYGRITANGAVIATFAILNSTAPNDAITINPTTGEITVATGLNGGTYSFIVEVTGTDNYTGSFTINLEFSVVPNIIQDDDFTVSSNSTSVTSAEFGYVGFIYGMLIQRNLRVTATIAIVNINAPAGVSVPPNAITIGDIEIGGTADINVAPGLDVGEYTFDVEIKGTGRYEGIVKFENFTLIITPQEIDRNDFTIPPSVTKALGYNNTSYGRIAANGEITATFRITTSNAPRGAITINPTTGEITVATGIDVGEYAFWVEVTGTERYTGSFTIINLKFSVTDNQTGFNLKNVFNVAANLVSPQSITSARVGQTNYLFVTENAESLISGVQVFAITNGGGLNNVYTIKHGIDTGELLGAYDLKTVVVGNKTYLLVTGTTGGGLSVFEVLPNGVLNKITAISDNDDNALQLSAARGVTTARVGSTTYVFVAGFVDRGLSGFALLPDGRLSNVFNLDKIDNPAYPLLGASGVTSAEVNGKTYLLATGYIDNGINIFEILPDGRLSNGDYILDNNTLNLRGADGVTTAKIGEMTYVFVAGETDNGISVFTIQPDGKLNSVVNANIADDATLQLGGAKNVITANINGKIYLFVTGKDDDGVSVLEVLSNGTLTNITNITDNDNPLYELDEATGITTSVVDGITYLFVAGKADNGISVFRVN